MLGAGLVFVIVRFGVDVGTVVGIGIGERGLGFAMVLLRMLVQLIA